MSNHLIPKEGETRHLEISPYERKAVDHVKKASNTTA